MIDNRIGILRGQCCIKSRATTLGGKERSACGASTHKRLWTSSRFRRIQPSHADSARGNGSALRVMKGASSSRAERKAPDRYEFCRAICQAGTCGKGLTSGGQMLMKTCAVRIAPTTLAPDWREGRHSIRFVQPDCRQVRDAKICCGMAWGWEKNIGRAASSSAHGR